MSVLIIGEIGVNHNGSEEEAYKLIDAAIAARANVCKFQLYDPVSLVEAGNKRDMLRRLLLPREAYIRLWKYCEMKCMGFACTAFDAANLEWLLANTKMTFVKISSGQWQNHDLLKVAAASGLPVIQSVAHHAHMCTLPHPDWRYLHVVSQYPTLPENSALGVMKRVYISGLSDHSGDIFMPLGAVALGAQIIESHITLDKNADGPDHKASLLPQQFTEMVRGIMAVEKALA